MNKVKPWIFLVMLAVSVATSLSVTTLPARASVSLLADSPSDIIAKKACETNPTALGCNKGDTALGADSIFVRGINVFIFVIAAVSVLIIVISGLRYVLSGGDPAGIKGAKDGIIYAIVGLVIAVLAFGIVNFVITKLG